MVLKFGLISLGSKSSQMLLEEAKGLFDVVDHIDLRKVEIKINGNTQVLYDGEPLPEYDCLLMKGSFKYSTLLYALSEVYKDKCYIPIDANAHIVAHNKFMTHLILAKDKSVKMPSTYFTAKISETKIFLKTLNYPIIMKFPSGTHGKGVIFAESYSSASSMIDALDVFNQPVIIQDYVNIKSDIRIIVAGNKIIGAMRRIAKADEVRANAHAGASAEVYLPTPEVKSMSIAAAKTLGAEICAVDIIESDYGPMVLEINTSPGLQKITETTRKNIARDMAQYLYDETLKRKQQKDKFVTKDVVSSLGIEEIGIREFESTIRVVNGKLVLPEFVSKMSDFYNDENVLIKVERNKIELIKQ